MSSWTVLTFYSRTFFLMFFSARTVDAMMRAYSLRRTDFDEEKLAKE